VSTVAVGSDAVQEFAGRTATHERIAHLEGQNAALRDEQRCFFCHPAAHTSPSGKEQE
jgi:hypothetical protein